MSRPKKEVRLNKVISFKVTEEQFNLIKSFSKEDKADYNKKLKELTERYIGLLLSQNKLLVDQNHDNKMVDQNNGDKVMVDRNDEVKPLDEMVDQNNDEDWTQDKISGFLDECIDAQSAADKRVKRSLRRLKDKKVQSEFEQAKAEYDAVEAAKYSGLNNLF